MNKKTMAILIVVLAGLLVWAVGSSGSGSLAQGGGEVGPQAVLTPLLQYQGRLTDPGTGEAVADGVYPISFRLYNVESGGSWLWMETEDVSVQGGLFSTVLGDTTALDQSLFNGQALWLGVRVDADAEATPRQQVLPVAYALSLVPGAVVEASSTDPILEVVQNGTGVGGFFTSASSYGVRGETASTSPGEAGVLGVAGWTGLTPSGEIGVFGKSSDGMGVAGMSDNRFGVYGYSGNSYGVRGEAMGSDAGVFGGNWGSGNGVHGLSSSGYGVYGSSTNGYGGRFTGNGGIYADGGSFLGGVIINNTTSHPTLRVNNSQTNGDLIEAINGGDLEFKVHGSGDVTADGAFTGGGADFAEMMAVNGDSADYEPGDVLVISSVKDRAIELSDRPYATNVVGIYSTRPGFVGTGHDPHETQPGEIPVAISGIVPCKVSAENGPIRRGDLLTTSNTPGHAMKADAIRLGEVEFYPPGTIVGKALEELSEGTSVISVLVALQ